MKNKNRNSEVNERVCVCVCLCSEEMLCAYTRYNDDRHKTMDKKNIYSGIRKNTPNVSYKMNEYDVTMYVYLCVYA